VSCSRRVSQASACSREAPHISTLACKPEQQRGRSGRPKIAQLKSGASCAQGVPAGLPLGMPGIGDVIDGAIQQAPQPGRQAGGMSWFFIGSFLVWHGGCVSILPVLQLHDQIGLSALS
jgi:hypothetical protein